MTEDDYTAPVEAEPEHRPLVEWQRTGRTKRRSELIGAFCGGLALGGLLVAALGRGYLLRR